MGKVSFTEINWLVHGHRTSKRRAIGNLMPLVPTFPIPESFMWFSAYLTSTTHTILLPGSGAKEAEKEDYVPETPSTQYQEH